ncbi:LEC14B protein-like isoform X1 [Gracilaria domingensis]|nr:LEC14B protein-like isoform X1 [Gracilaria domingensis]
MFVRQLDRLIPYERFSHRSRPRNTPPSQSPSLIDLEQSISQQLHLPSSRKIVSRYRALDAASKGFDVLPSVMQHAMLPNVKHHIVESQPDRVYGARFVGEDGDMFVTSIQGTGRHYRSSIHEIHVYSTSMSEHKAAWKRTHTIRARNVRWTVTDFAVSPDGRWLAYASINSYINLVDLQNPRLSHNTFNTFNISSSIEDRLNIWSLMWSHDGTELIAATGASKRFGPGNVVIFNIHTGTISSVISAHQDDVNSVCYLQHGDGNMIVSASDDVLVKLWDRRENKYRAGRKIDRPCALFVGHQYGLTHVSSKNDGRFLISNGKDQFIKLWDARKCTATDNLDKVVRPPRDVSFDYRLNPCPLVRQSRSFQDDSVATYAGSHETLQTLIRAHFSPMHSTGQKYIYCGSSDGCFVIYDVLSGEEVEVLRGHRDVVRDVSWHPYGGFLTTGSWDGEVALWSTHADPTEPSECGMRGADKVS